MAAGPGRRKYCFIYILVPNLTPSYVSREAGHGMVSIIPTQKRQLHAREAFLYGPLWMLYGWILSTLCVGGGGAKKYGLKPHFFRRLPVHED